jgi:hypothetical protein
MIDQNCEILKSGKGFCWCPSSAWDVGDNQLCQLCKVKNAEARKKIEFILSDRPARFSMKKENQYQTKLAASV